MERKPIAFMRIAWRLGLFWLIIPLGFAIVFGGLAVSMGAQAALLARDGVTGEAEVIERQITRRRDSEGRETTTYYLRYRYTAEGRADQIEKRTSVSRDFYEQTHEGALIPVTYAWTQPERASVDLRHDRFGLYMFGVVGLLGLLASIGMGWWMLGRKMSVLRALRQGEVREARVTGFRRTNVSRNKRPQYVIDWIDATGVKGSSMMDDQGAFLDHPTGSVIVVYVDPKTGRGWWESQF